MLLLRIRVICRGVIASGICPYSWLRNNKSLMWLRLHNLWHRCHLYRRRVSISDGLHRKKKVPVQSSQSASRLWPDPVDWHV